MLKNDPVDPGSKSFSETVGQLIADKEELRLRLEEAEETIRALRAGEIDAVVVVENGHERIYTFETADRPYRLMVEQMQQGAATLSAAGTILYANARLAQMAGKPLDQLIGSQLADLIEPSSWRNFDSQISGMQAEVNVSRAKGGAIPAFLSISNMKESDNLIAIFTDLTEQETRKQLERELAARKTSEETERRLKDELAHRVKNTLAVVQAIALQVLRRAEGPGHFEESFCGKIQALAKAHAGLSESRWSGANLASIIREQVLLGDREDRIDYSGPSVLLPPDVTVEFALTLHELGTNARKYGALSAPEGRLAVTWRTERDSDGSEWLELDWIESGGPAVTPPSKSGLGTALITRGLSSFGAKVELNFKPAGVVCKIRLPLPMTSSA
jgi:PAS domain S-box-containing protein